MTNLVAALKDEITRLARKEIKGESESLRKSTTRHRAEIAALKRRMDQLEKQFHRLERLLGQKQGSAANSQVVHGEAVARDIRFSPRGLRTHRERLSLSAADLGQVLGVSPATIYNWETGKSRPRSGQLTAIAQFRRMGKREVQAALAQQVA